MKRTIGWVILGMVAVIAIAVWQHAIEGPPASGPPLARSPEPPQVPSAEPAIRYPVPRAPQEEELPALPASDSTLIDALAALWGERAFEQLFHPGDLVRRIVVTIDNLPRRKVALRLMPLKPVPGEFRTTGKGENLAMSPDNAARYATHVQLAKAIDSAKLVAVYHRFYPLFQQAYEELGYPGAYFNDRLVEVIDHLLAAPELPAQAKLVRPKIFYRFDDPELESSSAGHKILMRIGNENAAVVKAKLRELRGELTRNGPR
ncbi:MAG TPA: DUF3014 domain-containing protein [Burkholderiales bacterium]|nr:DUF3014 domain-containing protein [Burkholderiales bacterium]